MVLEMTNSQPSHTKFKLTDIATATNMHVDYLHSITGNEKKGWKKLALVGFEPVHSFGWQTLILPSGQ